MPRLRSAAWWLAPTLLCLAVYWCGIRAWFQADDFAWLGLRMEVTDWHSLLRVLLEPRAQGTIRPWSERAFFLALYSIFGLDALPFRICVFLTQAANLALLASVTRRIAGSRAAGLLAAVFWLSTTAMSQPMVWTSVYNQVLCSFFILLAFYFLLRFLETGRRRYEVLEWAAFLLGFGALELNVVYPALAAAYTLLCARKYFARTLPLFVPSVAYTVLHMRLAPATADPSYILYFDSSIFRTLLTYWAWTVGPARLRTPWNTPTGWVIAGIAVLSAALLALVAARLLKADRLPLFCLAWFVIVLAPLLPLRDHLTEYYPFIPAIGLAMLSGYGVALAWRRPAIWKVVSASLAAMFLVLTLPAAQASAQWVCRRSRRVEGLVLQERRAHELHPGKVIVLRNVDDELFWMGVLDRPGRLFGAQVYLAPGSEKLVRSHPELGDANEYMLPAEATARALDRDQLAVYDAAGERLRNVTQVYARDFPHPGDGAPPRRIDLSNTLMGYVLGPEWYESDGQTRWMPKRATLRIAGPKTPSEKLILRGICPAPPAGITVTAAGVPLAPTLVANRRFELSLALPPSLVGVQALPVTLEVSRTVTPPGDGRQLGLAFGVIEVR